MPEVVPPQKTPEEAIEVILASDHPFHTDTLEKIGAVEGVILELPGGQFTLTEEAMTKVLTRLNLSQAVNG